MGSQFQVLPWVPAAQNGSVAKFRHGLPWQINVKEKTGQKQPMFASMPNPLPDRSKKAC
jgi:hypothetical protein